MEALAASKAASEPKAKGKAKGSAKGNAKPKAVPKMAKKAPKVEISHEKSRSQFLCRTGLPEYPSKTFKYKGSAASQRAALQDANKWCLQLCKKLKVDGSQFDV